MEAIKLEMAPGEKRPFSFDFKRRAELRTDTIDPATLAITITPANGITAGVPQLSNTAVLVTLTAGTTKQTVRLTVTARTVTSAYIEIGYVDVTITEPPP